MLKLEIGGDANSTDGSEPSVEHTRRRGELQRVDMSSGWRSRRSAAIQTSNCMVWPGPRRDGLGMVAFWSQDMVDYLMTWMDCAHSHGLAIDYIGGWNERGFDATWYQKTTCLACGKEVRDQGSG